MAQEANLRAQKQKLVREIGEPMQIYKMELLRGEEELEEETPQPIITIQVGEEQLVTQAFIDSGAYGNTISNELYKQLKDVELHETTTVLKLFSGHKTKPHGVCMLQVFFDELSCGDKFFVTQVGLQDVPIILSRTWQRKHNCFFNWEKKLVHCQSTDNKLWVPLHQIMLDLVECSSKDQEEARE